MSISKFDLINLLRKNVSEFRKIEIFTKSSIVPILGEGKSLKQKKRGTPIIFLLINYPEWSTNYLQFMNE